MDKRRNYYMVLDVETANSIDDPLVYDLGFAIVDKQGNIYEKHSFVISEIFYGMNDIMQSAYYANKLPQYHDGINTGDWQVASLFTVRRIVLNCLKEWNIKAVCAYNASFDRKALNSTLRYLTKSKNRWFFPYNTEFYDIWHMAAQTLCCQKTFFKIAKCENWMSKAGNIKTSAEIVWRYISSDLVFEESHTGLKDVEIETAIMSRCFRQHKSMKTYPNRLSWTIPQKKWHSFLNVVPF